MRLSRIEMAYRDSCRDHMRITSMHYLITGKERAKKRNSTGSYEDDSLCGHGSFHALRTNVASAVTCKECLTILATKPDYLDPR